MKSNKVTRYKKSNCRPDYILHRIDIWCSFWKLRCFVISTWPTCFNTLLRREFKYCTWRIRVLYGWQNDMKPSTQRIWSISLSLWDLRLPRRIDSCGRMEKPESGIRNRNRNLNWDQGKLGSTETSSWYPCGNKIQDGILCYHCFEKFSAQWSWYQRYTHIRKVTCKKKVSASYCYS